jgi:hypothetical protein
MKDFVFHEEALALKELGFEFDKDSVFVFGYWNLIEYDTEWTFDTRVNMDSVNYIEAPLYSQAFRFFREKYGLFISFVRYRISVVIEMPDTFSKVYEIWIQDENKDESIWVGSFDGQEEAELACLRKLIEIVKQKQ